MRDLKYILPLLVALSLLAGCEQKVDIKLNETEARVVIEGWVTDDPGPYDFKITKTGAYLGNGAEQKVTGAFAILRDDLGHADTLVERGPGWYQSTDMQGQMMHNYFLEVTVEGKQYKASNYLPRINPILGAGYEYNDTIIFGKGYYVGMLALEPAGIGDFYQFRFTRNDTAFNSAADIFVTDDRYVDGQVSPFLYPYPCRLGDTVVVEVRSLSQSTYDFYITLAQQGAGVGGPFASVPDNIASNFDNGAFGWFGTVASRRATLVIQ
jgi:Domain of unknown function (DUF4249)